MQQRTKRKNLDAGLLECMLLHERPFCCCAALRIITGSKGNLEDKQRSVCHLNTDRRQQALPSGTTAYFYFMLLLLVAGGDGTHPLSHLGQERLEVVALREVIARKHSWSGKEIIATQLQGLRCIS